MVELVSNKMEMMWKDVVVFLLLLPRDLPGGTEEEYECPEVTVPCVADSACCQDMMYRYHSG